MHDNMHCISVNLDQHIIQLTAVIGMAHQPVQLVILILKSDLNHHCAANLIVIHLYAHTLIGVIQLTFQHSQSEINQTIIAVKTELHWIVHPIFMG